MWSWVPTVAIKNKYIVWMEATTDIAPLNSWLQHCRTLGLEAYEEAKALEMNVPFHNSPSWSCGKLSHTCDCTPRGTPEMSGPGTPAATAIQSSVKSQTNLSWLSCRARKASRKLLHIYHPLSVVRGSVCWCLPTCHSHCRYSHDE